LVFRVHKNIVNEDKNKIRLFWRMRIIVAKISQENTTANARDSDARYFAREMLFL
jgi:hypothetical protein